MDTQLAQIHLLIDLKRYQDAEGRLREALAREPQHAEAHRLLAYTLYHQDRNTEALREIQVSIGLEPAEGHNYYVCALIFLEMERANKAMAMIQEALRLDPEIAAYHAALGHIYLYQKAWHKALDAARTGLRINPEDVACINVQATALVKLGLQDSADETLTYALSLDPANATTHANQGWAYLHQGEHQPALEHFREALRLNPMSDWARQGIVEALKARNPIYRMLLRYFLWMSRLTTGEQWAVSATSSGVLRVLRLLARQIPVLYVIVLPLALLYFTFSVLTWIARPLFALVLRFDKFGRLALPQEEITASNWIGVCLFTGIGSLFLAGISAIATLMWDIPLLSPTFLVLAVVALALMVPISGIFRCPPAPRADKRQRPGTRRLILIVYTVLLALIGLGAAIIAIFQNVWTWGTTGILLIIFAAGWMLYTWVANLVITIGRP
ncbi:MAG: tetratricopeptide repeat protein [Anaerolineae bacterium]|nr:tetratricopeptide repeat protein [Anaerolineae bacterium]